jgi:hypothetical protein
MNLPESKLVRNQKKVMTKVIDREKLVVTIRHDDECENGHNSFSITGTLSEKKKNNRWYECSWGMLHEDVARFFPELTPYLKWHLCSTDGPMHYLANTTYHARAESPNIDFARSTAVWPEATLAQLQSPALLLARLPDLMQEFKAAVESLGLVY